MSWLNEMKEKQYRKKMNRVAEILASEEYQQTLETMENCEGAAEEAWQRETGAEDGRGA